ncbi:hypothetical protein QBE55_07895 [Eubacteriales bacterium mix99]|jgi:hypothetical protein
MKAARIVYTVIGILIFLPWLSYLLKTFLRLRKGSKRPTVCRILSIVVITVLLFGAVYGHYRFTVGHQAPLVAEQAGQLWNRCLEGNLELSAYSKKMREKGLSAPRMKALSEDNLKSADFPGKHSDLSLSEKTHPTEDGGLFVYLMHTDGSKTLYTRMKLKRSDYRWQVAEQKILSQKEFDSLNEKTKIRFYAVSS